ncbi:hypothetical protein [Micromonospora sp. WMMD998]|uniref:phasin family protein n=1 Tax=Micromonospora sp. WMMD998 TaxID=3016092 RepID=UPI00249A28BE|nr:hypothetical protein [Micromonospora sp. WMMD998]WFE39765.1 hypothetical protein O7619_15540 [Micromonospora sp. WMMD998]
MQDAWRAYLELAMGLTEAPRKKAQGVVRRAVGQSGATAVALQSLAEELVATGLANREALTKLVRFEVDRALGAVGLATADEVAELTRRVHDLERQLREARAVPEPATAAGREPTAVPTGPSTPAAAGADAAPPTKTAPSPDAAPPTKAVAKKAVAKKAVARKPSATVARTPAGGTPAAPRAARKAGGPRTAGS